MLNRTKTIKPPLLFPPQLPLPPKKKVYEFKVAPTIIIIIADSSSRLEFETTQIFFPHRVFFFYRSIDRSINQ